MDKLKILHIEDQTMFSEALAGKLADQFEVTLAQTEADVACALAQQHFDVILLDVMLANRQNALGFMKLLAATATPVIVLSGEATPADQRALALLGARAFIPKSYPVMKVQQVIEAVLLGHTHFPPEFMATINSRRGRELPHMSPRKIEVLGKLCERPGISNQAIADELGVSPDWIKTLIGDLFRAFGVSGRVALVVEARERGFFPQRELFAA